MNTTDLTVSRQQNPEKSSYMLDRKVEEYSQYMVLKNAEYLLNFYGFRTKWDVLNIIVKNGYYV